MIALENLRHLPYQPDTCIYFEFLLAACDYFGFMTLNHKGLLINVLMVTTMTNIMVAKPVKMLELYCTMIQLILITSHFLPLFICEVNQFFFLPWVLLGGAVA